MVSVAEPNQNSNLFHYFIRLSFSAKHFSNSSNSVNRFAVYVTNKESFFNDQKVLIFVSLSLAFNP